MVNTTGDPASTTMTGPRNPVLESQFPNAITAPATDISTQPFFWSSFNISPRRQQRGGWAREVTQADFAISNEIAGVNMYLESGGIRELHWHQSGEWALMTEGKCRITTLSREGMPSVEDVFAGDLWFFPTGLRTPCRAWARTARSSCSPSTTGPSPRATRCSTPAIRAVRRPAGRCSRARGYLGGTDYLRFPARSARAVKG